MVLIRRSSSLQQSLSPNEQIFLKAQFPVLLLFFLIRATSGQHRGVFGVYINMYVNLGHSGNVNPCDIPAFDLNF